MEDDGQCFPSNVRSPRATVVRIASLWPIPGWYSNDWTNSLGTGLVWSCWGAATRLPARRHAAMATTVRGMRMGW